LIIGTKVIIKQVNFEHGGELRDMRAYLLKLNNNNEKKRRN